MVTAETAVVLLGVVLVLGMLLWVAMLVTAQVQVLDAARAGARAAARGESFERVAALAEDMAPPNADATVSRSGSDVRVEVSVVVQPFSGLRVLPAVRVDAIAYAAAEDAVGAGVRTVAGPVPARPLSALGAVGGRPP